MSIHLVCGTCALPFEAPAAEDGTVVISVETLTLLPGSAGKHAMAMCSPCADTLAAEALAALQILAPDTVG